MTDKEVLLLRQQRGRIKASTTKVLHFAENITEEITKGVIEARLQKLEQLYENFVRIDDQLVLHNNLSEVDEFEDRYYDAKGLMLHALKEKPADENNRDQVNSPEISSIDQLNATVSALMTQQNLILNTVARSTVVRNSESSAVDGEIRLPKIGVPTFSGNFKDWPSFKDLFCASIDRKSYLSDSQKLQYLKGALTGEAATMVKHFPITDSSYPEAWKKLIARYENKKQILASYIKTFVSQPAVTTPSTQLRRLTDLSDEIIRGIKSLDLKANERDPWLIFITLSKCDSETRQAWAEESTESEFPAFDELLKFLDKRCDALDTVDPIQRKTVQAPKFIRNHNLDVKHCLKCEQPHRLFACPEFRKMDVEERRRFVMKNRMCFNCMGTGHMVMKCKSKSRCNSCSKSHHTLLHLDEEQAALLNSSAIQPKENINQLEATTNVVNLPSFILNHQSPRSSLLPTALTLARDSSGSFQYCRVLLDSASTASFVSKECALRLGHQITPASVPVISMSSTVSGITKGFINFQLQSRFDDYQLDVGAFIVPKITSRLPSTSFAISNWNFINDCNLADPYFNMSNRIDILLGTDYFFYILKGGPRIIGNHMPAVQDTIFGHIVAGVISSIKNETPGSFHLTLINIDSTLRKFWEIEGLQKPVEIVSPEEKFCEDLFAQTTTVDDKGRYVVRLPFKQNSESIGLTMNLALARFRHLENRFKTNQLVAEEYKRFMSEYESLGHMELVNTSIQNNPHHVYLPHHPVFKLSSTTTKLRVVFDGSAVSSTGISLNQVLCAGPKVQRDLYPILINFRTFKIAVTADIEKMFRQIRVASEDCDFQKILWRDDPGKEIKQYRLNTVTYGTTPAPFLAKRALKQLRIEFAGKYPLAEQAIDYEFYMDDLMSGAHDEESAVRLYNELTELFNLRNFKLRKWMSNSDSFLKSISSTEPSVPKIITQQEDITKILGLSWIPTEDVFTFQINLPTNIKPTKRNILSTSSRVFDPLGFLAPLTVKVKMLLQDLWIKNLNWDDIIEGNLATRWEEIANDFMNLKELRISRWLRTGLHEFELHGFSDASEDAYAASIYVRTIDSSGKINMNLVTAKTKVAPITRMTIAKLELAGAHLLAKLLVNVKTALNKEDIRCFAWTDSKIVISWLSSHPSRWKSYVGNRVSEILSLLPRGVWNHVYSRDNPSDLASRGVSSQTLIDSKLWWSGPDYLQNLEWTSYIHDSATTTNDCDIIDGELRPRYIETHITLVNNHTIDYLFGRISSLMKILRVLGRCYQFIDLFARKETRGISSWITTDQLGRARITCIRWCQMVEFNKEINDLKKSNEVAKTSTLRKLSPFLDSDGLLRVGGRLENSSCSFNVKHPYILPKSHIFTRLLIEYIHQKHMHSGTALILNILRQEFWIVSARVVVKSIINKCLKCIRQRAITSQQLMGELPVPRVTFTKAFENTGVDYAGPILLLRYRGRGTNTTKGYICLFTCLATRAFHLELASDLTSEAFLGCLKRFTSRRGLPVNLYSDNGTNFVGANKQLKEIYQTIKTNHHNQLVADYLSSSKVNWHFNPPAAPHFGGCWESGVKLVKAVMRKIIGETKLTFEEMSTFLVQVEALLNSRPLIQLTDDIDNLDVLTPAHFLIGQPMLALPEMTLESSSKSMVNKWRHLTRMKQMFWKRWYMEYLTTLQQRPKWLSKGDNFKKGDLVLVKEDNLPPTVWSVGRITTLHPGNDHIVRVVTLKTSRGELKRPITKLCKLPID